MHVHYIVLLIGALVASADAFSAATKSTNVVPEFPAVARSLTSGKNNVRFLRSHKTAISTESDDEERGIFEYIDDVVKYIKLSPEFKQLMKKQATAKEAYEVFKMNAKDPDESLAAAMSVEYGADGLSKMLAKAVQSPNAATKDIATKLEAAQLSRWTKLDSSPDDIFTVLKLEQKVNNKVFDTPQFATWTTYAKAYNQRHQAKPVSEWEVLTTHYGEEAFLKLLGSADDNSAGTQAFKKYLGNGWLDEPTHPLNVFNKLKLDKAGDDLFTNPLLSTWVQYMKAFNKEYPHAETTMIQTLTKSYGGDEKLAKMIQAATKVPSTEQLAKNLQSAQFNRWMVEEKTPKDMLSVLKLNSQTFTDNPSADIWRAYNKA